MMPRLRLLGLVALAGVPLALKDDREELLHFELRKALAFFRTQRRREHIDARRALVQVVGLDLDLGWVA